MDLVVPGVYQWSVFNEEKGMDFNGLYLQCQGGTLLIDPPPLSDEEIPQIESLGKPQFIYLTNKHHTRDSAAHRKRWGAKVLVPEDDRPLMEIEVDGTFSDGELIAGDLEAINLPDSKTPGECAFHWPAKKILILGDAIIGTDKGLAMLPDEKFKDPALARSGLRVLQGLEYDILLLGDGKCVTSNASQVVEKFIDSLALPKS